MNTGIAGQFGFQVQPFFQRALPAGGKNFDFRGPAVTAGSRSASPATPVTNAASSGSLAQQVNRGGLGVGLSQLLNRSAGVSTSQALQVSENSARRLEIALTTRDGDRVILSLSQISATQETFQSSHGRGFSLTANDSAVLFSGRFSLTVQGQLDQGEIKAIQHLLHKAEKLAAQFFSGNLQQAVAKVQDIKLDHSELDAFSLDLSATRSRQISSYQSVAASTAGGAVPLFTAVSQQPANPPSANAAATVGAPSAVRPATLQDVIPEAKNIFQQLLQGVLALSSAPSTSSNAPNLPSAALPAVSRADQLITPPEQAHAHEDE